jgi:hypothetical protein
MLSPKYPPQNRSAREGGWGKGGGRGKRGEMTQILYVHLNKRKKQNKQGWWSASSDRALVYQALNSNASISKKKTQQKGAKCKQSPPRYTCHSPPMFCFLFFFLNIQHYLNTF